MRGGLRTQVAAAGLGLLALVANACELALPLSGYAGADASTDGALRDGPIESANEAGVDSSSDVGVDTSAQDSSDSGDSRSPDAGPWCASQEAGYLLCSDFDTPGATVDQDFDLSFQYNGLSGTFSFDSTHYQSSPRSAQGMANGFPAGGVSGIQLTDTLWTFEATPARVTCSAEWLPISLPSSNGFYSHIFFFTVYASDDASSELRGIGINIMNDGTLQFLDDIAANTSNDTTNEFGTFDVVAGMWTHVALTLTSTGTTTSYSAVVGGVTGTGTLTVPLETMTHMDVGFGPAYFGGATTMDTPSWAFDYDNVLCY